MAEHQEDVTDPRSTVAFNEKVEEQYVSSSEILKGAEKATEEEHSLSLFESIRRYPKACAWSLLFSSALIMEGFDHSFVSGFVAFPAFQKRYGVEQKPGDWQIPAEIQSGIKNGLNAGEIIGLILNGFFVDWFGYRWVMIGSLFLMCAFIFLQFFATDIYMYMGAEILLGVPWGAFQTLTTTYASECCPTLLRPYLTMLVSLCWSVGYLAGTGALRGFLAMEGEWAYRIPFALQWALPIPLAIGIFLAPESPWWLVRKGRTEDASKALRRLGSHLSEEEVVDATALMVYTYKCEQEMKTTSSYLDLFRGFNLRRTEIVVMVYVVQELCAPLVSEVVYFLEQAGLSPDDSFDFGMGEYALAIIGVFIAWWMVPRIGRRTLLLWGTLFMALTSFIIGFLGIPNYLTHPNIAYAIGSILLVEYFVFFFTVAPVVYTLVTEIPSNYLRTKSVALARAMYNINVLIYGQLVPHMIQTTSWNWGAKSGFFYGGFMFLGLLWAYFRVPETKDRTFAEIDILFKNKVKARHFSKTRVTLADMGTTEA